MTERIAKASVFTYGDDGAWLVAETPSEVEQLVIDALANGDVFVTLTSGVKGVWNAKPFKLRADSVYAMSPPMDQDEE